MHLTVEIHLISPYYFVAGLSTLAQASGCAAVCMCHVWPAIGPSATGATGHAFGEPIRALVARNFRWKQPAGRMHITPT